MGPKAHGMAKKSKTRCIGILTSGGDCPGLNAAIRAIAKPAINEFGMKVIGILDGFRGLVENRTMPLDDQTVSGILTRGGTVLGTSRDKIHKMRMGTECMDMTQVAIENTRKLQIDCLVCLGGGGTQKQAWRLHTEGGLAVMTLPKTIDNDVAGTDVSFGFDTARNVAAEAIDRLHTTATSHHRIIVCEVMGHKAGWLALEAGLSGGADVILIPELPYDLEIVAEFLSERRRHGKRFSIIVAAEGARSREETEAIKHAARGEKKKGKAKSKTKSGNGDSGGDPWQGLPPDLLADETRDSLPVVVRRVQDELMTYHAVQEPMASRIARHLQELTGTEARVTSLGHVQRGGIPTSFDRMLCTLLGTTAAQLMAEGTYNVMVGWRNNRCQTVGLEEITGRRKTVPPDDPMIVSARLVGTCFGHRRPIEHA